jgi:hypothetical protein
MKTATKLLLIATILFSLSSCVTQRGVEKWIKKNPDKINIDSIYVRDTLTFISEKVETDTVFSVHTKDTMIIRKDNLTVKTFVYKDSIYVYGECDTDTVTIIQDRWVGNSINLEEKRNWFEKNWLILILIVGMFIIILKK